MESRPAVLARIASPEVSMRLAAVRGILGGAWHRKLPTVPALRGATRLMYRAVRWAMVGR
jgi:hypothetical protein